MIDYSSATKLALPRILLPRHHLKFPSFRFQVVNLLVSPMILRRSQVAQVVVATGLYLLALCLLAGLAIGIHTLRGEPPNRQTCSPFNRDCNPKGTPDVRPDGET